MVHQDCRLYLFANRVENLKVYRDMHSNLMPLTLQGLEFAKVRYKITRLDFAGEIFAIFDVSYRKLSEEGGKGGV